LSAGIAVNFSNELQVSVVQLVDRILAALNSDLKVRILNQASNEIINQYLSAERVRLLLGWEPLFTLEEGLTRTISWYREYFQ